jgi:hypothetical protein
VEAASVGGNELVLPRAFDQDITVVMVHTGESSKRAQVRDSAFRGSRGVLVTLRLFRGTEQDAQPVR